MTKLLFGALIAGLVTSCAPEVAEEPSSSVLVNTNSGTTIPEGITIHDVDINSDGTINMDDLVIVGKFFGQDVPQTDDLAMASDTDNTDNYVYALMELTRFDDLEKTVKEYIDHQGEIGVHPSDVDYPQHWNKEFINNELAYLPDLRKNYHELSSARLRFAFRFLTKTIDGIPNIIEVKVKPVNEHMHKFVKKTITQSLDADNFYYLRSGYLPKTTTDGGGKEVHVKISAVRLPEDGYDFRPIKIGKNNLDDEMIVGRVTITVHRTNQTIEVYTKDSDVADSWPDRIDKSGIKTRRRYFHLAQATHYYLADDPPFGIHYLSDRCDSFYREICYGSSYMASDEVKAKYFPEDLE